MPTTKTVGGFHHVPVLEDAVLRYLAPRDGAVVCDATLGGAGHAQAVLEASSPAGRLVGIDRDRAALDAAGQRLQRFGDRVTLVQGTFGELPRLLEERGLVPLDGILADLGVSSHQLDTADRGFSFSRSGPLDMRMNPDEGETLADFLRRTSPDELARVIREYGEERYAARIARNIKAQLADLSSTTDLAQLVAASIPMATQRREHIHPATRTFQALRIALNDELGELTRLLDGFVPLLREGGRLVIIAFHSLEDRLVKRRFRELAWTSRLPDDLAAQAGERTVPVCRPLTSRPVMATDTEIAQNPRARSARLRACQKVSA